MGGFWAGRTVASLVWRGRSGWTWGLNKLELHCKICWGFHICENSNSAWLGFCWTKLVTREVLFWMNYFSKPELWHELWKFWSIAGFFCGSNELLVAPVYLKVLNDQVIILSFLPLVDFCCLIDCWIISVLLCLPFLYIYKKCSRVGFLSFNNGRQKFSKDLSFLKKYIKKKGFLSISGRYAFNNQFFLRPITSLFFGREPYPSLIPTAPLWELKPCCSVCFSSLNNSPFSCLSLFENFSLRIPWKMVISLE